MTSIIRVGVVALLLPLSAHAAEPVRQIGIYVQPFYQSVLTADEKPQVAVGQKYNALLASSRREDILAVRDLIVVEPELVTPMTLMVLAIRFYGVGLRDEAVFWFYLAKERYIVMSEVLDTKSRLLAQADDAVRAFATLAGPVINGYAFCDLAKEQKTHAKAIAWVEANPYGVIFMERMPALPGTVQSTSSAGSPTLESVPPRSAPISRTPKTRTQSTPPAGPTRPTSSSAGNSA